MRKARDYLAHYQLDKLGDATLKAFQETVKESGLIQAWRFAMVVWDWGGYRDENH